MLLLWCALAAGACTGPDAGPDAGRDAWLRTAPDGAGARRVALAEPQWCDVPPPQRATALRALDSVAVVPLTPQQAQWLAGREYTGPAHLRPYLVRAVYGHAGTGAYRVATAGDSLFVHHGSLGRSAQVHRSALVVYLAAAPTEVFPTLAIAE